MKPRTPIPLTEATRAVLRHHPTRLARLAALAQLAVAGREHRRQR